MSDESQVETSEVPAEEAGVMLTVKLLQGGVKIGTHLRAKGVQVKLPEAQAKALEALGMVRIVWLG